MKNLLILTTILISVSANASLYGTYELTTEDTQCPVGDLKLQESKEDKEKYLIFGSRHSWTMKLESSGVIKEKTDEGCLYESAYKLKDDSFEIRTTRSKCPLKKENGNVSESLELKGDKLNYSFEFKSLEPKSSNKFKCAYTKKN